MNTDEAIFRRLEYINEVEYRPACYKDFEEFEVDGKLYKLKPRTLRNKFSILKKRALIERLYNSRASFFVKKGVRFGKLRQIQDMNERSISQLSKAIQLLPEESKGLHDIHTSFKMLDIWQILSESKRFKVNQQKTAVYDVLQNFREGTNIRKNDMTERSVADLVSEPKMYSEIEVLYKWLVEALPPQKKISLPYTTNRKERANGLIPRIGSIYDIDKTKRPSYRIEWGNYDDGVVKYPFAFEVLGIPLANPIEDNNRTIKISTEFYNKDTVDILPDSIRDFLEYVQIISEVAIAKTKNDIELKLQKVEGFLEVQIKKKEIVAQLKDALAENEELKVIAEKCEEMVQAEAKTNDDG